jgi:hypothetical protein
MIPNKFKFTINSGTGIIYNAEYDYDKHNYCITWENYKTYYDYFDVKQFLSNNGWQIYEEKVEVEDND